MTEAAVTGKSADAYRTIGEAADELRLPQHVLRFWETRFPQVIPLKRAGGRRFYRPEDLALLGAIKVLLYGEGYTIKGVQRLLADQGPRAVIGASAMSGTAEQRRPSSVERSAPAVVGSGRAAPATPPRDMADMRDHDARVSGPEGEAPSPSAPARRPAAMPPGPVGRQADTPHVPSSTGSADVRARLEAVAFDLGECGRILAAGRAARP